MKTDDGVETSAAGAKEKAQESEAVGALREEPAEPQAASSQKRAPTTLEETILLAKRGQKEILPLLRRQLDAHPEFWLRYGNLALQSQESWVQLIAGNNLYLAECVRRQLDSMRIELAGTKASPLEQLLVDRILGCYLQMLYFDCMEAQAAGAENLRTAQYRAQRQEQGHRQFLGAVKMLATVRQLMARTIQVDLIQYLPAVQPTPAIPTGNSGQPTGKPRTKRRASAARQSTGSIGCSRLGRFLEPAAVGSGG